MLNSGPNDRKIPCSFGSIWEKDLLWCYLMNTLYQPFTMDTNGIRIWELEYCFLASWGVIRCQMGKVRPTSLLNRKTKVCIMHFSLQLCSSHFNDLFAMKFDPDLAIAGVASRGLQNGYCKGKHNLSSVGTRSCTVKILPFPHSSGSWPLHRGLQHKCLLFSVAWSDQL